MMHDQNDDAQMAHPCDGHDAHVDHDDRWDDPEFLERLRREIEAECADEEGDMTPTQKKWSWAAALVLSGILNTQAAEIAAGLTPSDYDEPA